MSKQMLLTAQVIDNKDPEQLGRVLLTLPTLPEGPQLWARVVSPLAGPERGQGFLPEIDDQVLVAFTQGDFSNAYVLGGLWGTRNPPPEGVGKGENDLKMIKTRSGHLLEFNDTEGSESITIKDKNGNTIIIETAEDRITITSKGELRIEAKGDIAIKGKAFTLNAEKVEIKADKSLTLDGGNTADLKAGRVNIN
jgi:uncharacterized protein involved in type VI secretion and phage assembly